MATRYYIRGTNGAGKPIEAEVDGPDDVRPGDAFPFDGERLQVREVRKGIGPAFATLIVGPIPAVPKFENPFEERDWNVHLISEQPGGTIREVEFEVRASHAEVRKRIDELAPGVWREKFGEDPPSNMSVNHEPKKL